MKEELFIYGKPASGDSFTDREVEQRQLRDNFKYGINTFIISPRRWGKTSLVMKVMDELRSAGQIVVFVDVFKCRTKQEFCESLSSAVFAQTASRMDEIAGNVKDFLSRVNVGVNLSPDRLSDFSVNLKIDNSDVRLEDMLDVPEKMAEKKGSKIIVCVDEFQQIAEFPDSLNFQKLLRTVWQHQERVTYCLFGSKKHVMERLMDDPAKPFYKFGDVIPLDRIPLNYWIPYIQERFTREGKSISENFCEQVCTLVDYNSYYVQQLSWYVFRETEKTVDDDALARATDRLVTQNTALFEARTDSLTAYQMNFLRALTDGIHQGLSSSDTIARYSLGSSANVTVVKSALVARDLITESEGRIFLSDPVMGLWLKK